MAFLNGSTNGRGVPRAEINMIPLIDVMLVLLVIFMVTAPLLTHAVKLELPRASSQAPQAAEKIDLSIDSEGRAFWNGKSLENAEVSARLAELGQRAPQSEIHLYADKNTRYERIAIVMSEATRAGLSKISFVTQIQSHS